MTLIDWIVTAAAVSVLLAAGFGAARWSRQRTAKDFMLGGRRLPWWLAGTAMVAGASNCDSPLHQSAKIRREGLSGGWFYWSQIFSGVWHSLVFSRLWRRTGVSTVVEFYGLRYATRGGQFARAWSMVFASIFGSVISLALGLLAMIKICQAMLDFTTPVLLAGHAIPPEIVIVVAGIVLALGYSLVSGLLGVVAGDIVEFLIATLCSYLLLFFVYRAVGYSSGLREGLERLGRSEMLSLTPAGGVSLFVFFVVKPFATLAGDNPLNQRFLAIRDERDAVLSGVWRLVNHYFIRCWPWYICGLVSVLLLPDWGIASETVYPRLIVDFMPEGGRGLMFAGFLVAFMSSVCSAMHSAGIVFVNDFYRIYCVKNAADRHYLWAIRGSMLVITAVATWIALASSEILHLVQVAMTLIAASGLVMLLRWFWWRVNGWADLAAQVLAVPSTLFFTEGAGQTWCAHAIKSLGGNADDVYALSFLAAVGVNTLLWLLVLAFTPPEPMEKLTAFYRQVKPYGFWGPVARACPETKVTDSFKRDLWRYVLGVAVSLGMLLGMGAILLGNWLTGTMALILCAVTGAGLVRSIAREYSAPVASNDTR